MHSTGAGISIDSAQQGEGPLARGGSATARPRSSAKHLRRACDVLAGLSFLSWAVLGLAHSTPADRTSIVRLLIAALNLLVGSLFLLRRFPRVLGGPGDLAAAMPSFLAGGAALKLTAAPASWPSYANVLFGVGTALTLWALASLGRSFAILPAASDTVMRGPYRLLRHPAYAGELLMIAACAVAQPSWPLAAIVLLAIPAVGWRVVVEERLLQRSAPGYSDYARRVRWRLLPGVW